jgi:hypothetical protein
MPGGLGEIVDYPERGEAKRSGSVIDCARRATCRSNGAWEVRTRRTFHKPQPSLRDATPGRSDRGLETHGYFRVVAPRLRFVDTMRSP